MDELSTPAELLSRASGAAGSDACAAGYYEGARDMLAAVRRSVRDFAADDADMARAFDGALGFVSSREDAARLARLAARRFDAGGSLESALALRDALEDAFSHEWDEE